MTWTPAPKASPWMMAIAEGPDGLDWDPPAVLVAYDLLWYSDRTALRRSVRRVRAKRYSAILREMSVEPDQL